MARFVTIYRIYNDVNGRSYIGQTEHLSERLSAHFSGLESGVCQNRPYLDDYRQYGRKAFHVEILEWSIASKYADKRETHWIKVFNSYHDGYNRTEGGSNTQLRKPSRKIRKVL